MGLMLMCGGQPATLEEVSSVPLPVKTDTYAPVPHADLVDLLRIAGTQVLGSEPNHLEMGLNCEGRQLFGTMVWEEGPKEGERFTLGFRNSYDKSLSVGTVGGLNTLVCDNLCMFGDALRVVRKHTPNVWDDVGRMVRDAMAALPAEGRKASHFLEGLRASIIGTELGFDLLGRAYGDKVLTLSQFKRAADDWGKEPEKSLHPEVHRTANGLYQSFTEGVKVGTVADKIERYTGVTSFFRETF